MCTVRLNDGELSAERRSFPGRAGNLEGWKVAALWSDGGDGVKFKQTTADRKAAVLLTTEVPKNGVPDVLVKTQPG